MWIECLIKRDGPTYVTIDKFDYCFKARPDFGGAAVCDVTNDSHVARLKTTGMYRKYKGTMPSASPDPKPLPGMAREAAQDIPEPEPDTPGEPGEDGHDEGDDGEEQGGEMTDDERDAALLNMVEGGMSYAKIAEVVGRSKSWVGNRVKLLQSAKG